MRGVALGAAAGQVLSYVILSVLLTNLNTPTWMTATPDWRVLLFAVAMSLVTAVLFRLTPALQIARPAYWRTISAAMRIATLSIALLMAAGLILLPILLRLPMPIQVGGAERTSQDAMVVTHDLRTGVLIEESDVRIVVVSRTLITSDIPRKRSEVLGHKTISPVQEGHMIHLSEVNP